MKSREPACGRSRKGVNDRATDQEDRDVDHRHLPSVRDTHQPQCCSRHRRPNLGSSRQWREEHLNLLQRNVGEELSPTGALIVMRIRGLSPQLPFRVIFLRLFFRYGRILGGS